MKKNKKNAGITLMSLVVTIIVMIILAGVSVGMITKDNEVVKQAKSAKKETERADLEEQIVISILQAEAKNNKPTIKDVISQLINDGIISDESQVDITLGTITVGGYVFENLIADYITCGDVYYADSKIEPTDQKYFTFTVNESTKTATITGIKEKYAEKTYYYGQSDILYDGTNGTPKVSINSVIKDGNTYIKDVVIPYEYVDGENKYTVTEIGDWAFSIIEEFGRNVNWYGIGQHGFEVKDNMFESFTIPNTITTIGKGAFGGNPKVKKIKISSSVTQIGEYAFASCFNITSINIPSSVMNIGNRAFDSWKSSQTINCQVSEKPSGWDSDWSSFAKVVWGVNM